MKQHFKKFHNVILLPRALRRNVQTDYLRCFSLQIFILNDIVTKSYLTLATCTKDVVEAATLQLQGVNLQISPCLSFHVLWTKDSKMNWLHCLLLQLPSLETQRLHERPSPLSSFFNHSSCYYFIIYYFEEASNHEEVRCRDACVNFLQAHKTLQTLCSVY